MDSKTLLEKVLEVNPAYSIANINEQKAKINIAIARSPLFPTISTGLDLGTSFYNSNVLFNSNQQIKNDFSNNFSIGISIPVFNKMQDIFNLKESRLLYNKSKITTQIEKDKVV